MLMSNMIGIGSDIARRLFAIQTGALSRGNEAKYPLADILHDIVKYSLTGKEYARLCALANSDSDLSEVDSAEYIALETKAKEPILSALDKFNFADCFVELMQEKFGYDLNKIKRFNKNNANLSIGIIFVALALDNAELKAVLQNELTGNQIHIIEKWQNFIYDDINDNIDKFDRNQIKLWLRDSSQNDTKMREIRSRYLGKRYEKTIMDFEAMCEVIIGVVKNLLEQPLFELCRYSEQVGGFNTKWESIMQYIFIEIIEDSLSASESRILKACSAKNVSEISDDMMSEFREVAQKAKDMLLANLATLSMNKLIALINNGKTTQLLPFSEAKLNDFGNMLKGEFTGNEFDELLALIKTRNEYIDGKIDDFSDEKESRLEELAQKARGIIIAKIEALEATAIWTNAENAVGESN